LRKLSALALVAALVAASALVAPAQPPSTRAPVCLTGACPTALTYPVYYRPAVASPAEDSPSAFLGLLNAARAQAGRPALAWDATLAAYAASNAAIHMPGSSGGAGQCWAGCRSYRQAFGMWASRRPTGDPDECPDVGRGGDLPTGITRQRALTLTPRSTPQPKGQIMSAEGLR
jgi:hypothetical protein